MAPVDNSSRTEMDGTMITRRKILGFLAAIPMIGAGVTRASAAEEKGIVETLEHTPYTHYKTRFEFPTEKEAIDFVRSLIPELTYVELQDNNYDEPYIRAGNRGAIRAAYPMPIHRTEWKIVSRKTEPYGFGVQRETTQDIQISDTTLWDIARAWACLENIRVNGKPVDRARNIVVQGRSGRSLSEYMTQPFLKGDPVIKTVKYD